MCMDGLPDAALLMMPRWQISARLNQPIVQTHTTASRLIRVLFDCNVSFVSHFFSLGDQMQGTGYSDATHPPGSEIFPLISGLGLTGATIGNHELFCDESASWLHAKIRSGALFTQTPYVVCDCLQLVPVLTTIWMSFSTLRHFIHPQQGTHIETPRALESRAPTRSSPLGKSNAKPE